jgi:DNA modification methylase
MSDLRQCERPQLAGLPEPYFDDGNGIVIYNLDYRDVLPYLAPDSVDLVLTDPPYGIRYMPPGRAADDPLAVPIHGDDSLNEVRDAMPLLDRLLNKDRHAYFFSSGMRTGECVDIVGAFWKVKNVLVWDKGNSGSRGDLKAGYGWNWEAIVYANKGRRALNGPRPRTIYRYDWQGTRDPVHPTVKPVGLMQWLITKSSQPDELLVDPFMGSGPVLRAARDLGRRAIGMEVEERYCEAAVRRLQREG